MTDPYSRFGTKETVQTKPVFGRDQVKNNAGGYVFAVSPMTMLRRFLTMGTAGGTFYVGEDELTEDNANMILELTKFEDTHQLMVDEIVEISLAGRAMKQQPTLFALAIACQHGSTKSKQYARKQITKVVRTGYHLFIFVGYLNQFGGWSRGLRKAVGSWYTEKSADQLAYQMVKYRQREGYTHRDVLRLSHPKFQLPDEMQVIKDNIKIGMSPLTLDSLVSAEEELLKKKLAVDWTVRGSSLNINAAPDKIRGYVKVNQEGVHIPSILAQVNLPWEALPDSAMNDIHVWTQLLLNGVPLGALLRQLPRLTRIGVVKQMDNTGLTNLVIASLTDHAALRKARIHPIEVLVALKTYSSGRSTKGTTTWSPVTKIIDALNDMFYASFAYLEPTGHRYLQAVDVSGSMFGPSYGSDFPLTPAEVAGAMALATASVEPNHMIMGFASLSGHQTRDPHDSALRDLNVSSRQRLDDVMRRMQDMTFGGTDCALPMMHALKEGWEIDRFIVYTDNETYHGTIHPFQALKKYRESSGIDAKLIVVAATPTPFSIADPSDKGMLDISGFDSAVPNLIAEFSRGTM